jgi:hypothetical protein
MHAYPNDSNSEREELFPGTFGLRRRNDLDSLIQLEPMCKSCVCVATLWPENPGARSEDFVLRELMREITARPRSYRVQVVVGSAHESGLAKARLIMSQFQQVDAAYIKIETAFSGRRAEEISFGKQELIKALSFRTDWTWLFYFDADVWTRVAQIEDWQRSVGSDKARCYINIKYTLRDALCSPSHTLGVYFHHRELLDAFPYSGILFPQDSNGHRLEAPDCALYAFLGASGCREVVPAATRTIHFRNETDAHLFDVGDCRSVDGIRDSRGTWSPCASKIRQLIKVYRIVGRAAHPIDVTNESQEGIYPLDLSRCQNGEISPYVYAARALLMSEGDFAAVVKSGEDPPADSNWLRNGDEGLHLLLDSVAEHSDDSDCGRSIIGCTFPREIAANLLMLLLHGCSIEAARKRLRSGLGRSSSLGSLELTR